MRANDVDGGRAPATDSANDFAALLSGAGMAARRRWILGEEKDFVVRSHCGPAECETPTWLRTQGAGEHLRNRTTTTRTGSIPYKIRTTNAPCLIPHFNRHLYPQPAAASRSERYRGRAELELRPIHLPLVCPGAERRRLILLVPVPQRSPPPGARSNKLPLRLQLVLQSPARSHSTSPPRSANEQDAAQIIRCRGRCEGARSVVGRTENGVGQVAEAEAGRGWSAAGAGTHQRRGCAQCHRANEELAGLVAEVEGGRGRSAKASKPQQNSYGRAGEGRAGAFAGHAGDDCRHRREPYPGVHNAVRESTRRARGRNRRSARVGGEWCRQGGERLGVVLSRARRMWGTNSRSATGKRYAVAQHGAAAATIPSGGMRDDAAGDGQYILGVPQARAGGKKHPPLLQDTAIQARPPHLFTCSIAPTARDAGSISTSARVPARPRSVMRPCFFLAPPPRGREELEEAAWLAPTKMTTWIGPVRMRGHESAWWWYGASSNGGGGDTSGWRWTTENRCHLTLGVRSGGCARGRTTTLARECGVGQKETRKRTSRSSRVHYPASKFIAPLLHRLYRHTAVFMLGYARFRPKTNGTVGTRDEERRRWFGTRLLYQAVLDKSPVATDGHEFIVVTMRVHAWKTVTTRFRFVNDAWRDALKLCAATFREYASEIRSVPFLSRDPEGREEIYGARPLRKDSESDTGAQRVCLQLAAFKYGNHLCLKEQDQQDQQD
ncbi:hypothetical protein DFH06DRAFT_1144138 [Mycena polygramma]|nr:hypothetical protein DFH06DRAFT_1144138 [Mycena polygramma]